MTDHQLDHDSLPEDDQPPFLGSWKNLYILVIVLHFVLIGLFYWFTHTYA